MTRQIVKMGFPEVTTLAGRKGRKGGLASWVKLPNQAGAGGRDGMTR